MIRTYGVIGLSWILACCGGRSASEADLCAAGGGGPGNAGNAVAGATELVSAANVGGAPTVAAGAPEVGGMFAGGAPLEIAGGANTTGTESAGSAGAQEDAGAGPVLDYSRARWPMPNSVWSGLPHPVSFDLSSPDIATDKVTGLVWQRNIKAYGVSMAEGASYCGQLSLAGHRDWRLPSRIELISLFDAADQSAPNPSGFPIRGVFLSSSLYMGTPQTQPWVWVVDVNGRYLSEVGNSTEGTAVCVRSNTPANADPAPPARVLTAEVVTDTGTGLSWERTPRSVWDTYAAAKTYCAGLSLGGYHDWRMPSVVEMLTLSEPSQLWPSIDTSEFPGEETIESGWFWSATPYPTPTPLYYAPGLNFGGLYVTGEPVDSQCLVRCVR